MYGIERTNYMAYNAYNNTFPIGYQQFYPQYQTPPSQQPQQSNSIIWVQGEAGAKSYLVAPNTTVQLWDSEAQVIYLKSADATGMPSIKTLDYTIREIPTQNGNPNHTTYATKDDLASIQNEIDKLKEELSYGKSTLSNNVRTTDAK